MVKGDGIPVVFEATGKNGKIRISDEDAGSAKDTFIEMMDDSACASLSTLEVYDLIELLAEKAGLSFEPTAARSGIIIQRPITEAEKTRRSELWNKFETMGEAIDHIIAEERNQGVLR